MSLFYRYISGDPAWIGFSMLDSNSGFVWTDGTPVSVFPLLLLFFVMPIHAILR